MLCNTIKREKHKINLPPFRPSCLYIISMTEDVQLNIRDFLLSAFPNWWFSSFHSQADKMKVTCLQLSVTERGLVSLSPWLVWHCPLSISTLWRYNDPWIKPASDTIHWDCAWYVPLSQDSPRAVAAVTRKADNSDFWWALFSPA